MVEFAPFLMVVLIVAIVCYTRLQRAKLNAAPLNEARDDSEPERLRAELRQLKDRIAVLERIVTDGDHTRSIALEREIEALRQHKE
ncbi:hypothetical protein [Sphingomonas nostoxanthinifaciens]|uniref:hypothetical protein n=1 Tax=Sphingomonas nostoxanthinifaciens TaxID=2872652 RepID=UPI001CC202AA|nr:hypothetical protein [Sphingomonas nostoxanthinifaciens]UAK26010.1 hypothetical protein K8P63_07835 [Sphingomonas nostoxanthinifaciens]